MKKLLLILLLLIFISFNGFTVYAEEENCNRPNANVTFVLKVYEKIPSDERKIFLELSDWQPLRQGFTKEGNNLYIDEIIIKSQSNECLREYSQMYLSVQSPKNESLGGSIRLTINSTDKNTYHAKRQINASFPFLNYSDHNNISFKLFSIKLDEVGIYKLDLFKERDGGEVINVDFQDDSYIQMDEIRVKPVTDFIV